MRYQLLVLAVILMSVFSLGGCSNTYHIIFDTNGGTDIEAIDVADPSVFTLPTPLKEGYHFSGWYMNEGLSESFTEQSVLESDITLYAKWESIEHEITFVTNGGTSVDDVLISHGETMDAPSIMRSSFVFEGWFIDSEFTQPFVSSIQITHDMTLYAKWEEIIYTISFESNDGSDVTPIVLSYGTVFEKPEEPTKSGFEFDGWYLNEALTARFMFHESNTMPKTDLVLYAKWVINIEIALITDGSGSVDDQSYIQAAWEGVVAYAEAHDKSYGYYQPKQFALSAYLDAIDLAITNGAKIIFMSGFIFENAAYVAQYEYSDIYFVLIDGTPHNVIDWFTLSTIDGNSPDFSIADNLVTIFYHEEQAGFLAGYASIKEGLTHLGFMGGMEVPAVISFGTGYVAGAYYAAYEMGINTYTFDPNRYEYVGTFSPDLSTATTATSWYQTGTDVIFSVTGGGILSIIMAAEQQSDKWVIGADTDQSSLSTHILTSAIKHITNTVLYILDEYDNDQFQGGESLRLGIENHFVGLPVDQTNWRFTQFSILAYQEIVNLLQNGTIVVPKTSQELQLFLEEFGYELSLELKNKIFPNDIGS